MRLLLLFALLLIGCGASSDLTNQPNAQVVKIGVIAPLNGGLVEFGRGIRNSVALAVAQANNSGRFPKLVFQLEARDDSSTPAVGLASAQQLAADPQVIGLVGTYNSGVAAVVQPVLSAAGIVILSPGNTNPSLTLPVRSFRNYFRLVVPDSIQGSVLAGHAFTTLGIRQVALVTENKAVSIALVDAFQTAFTALGGTITTREVIPDGTTDFSAIINRIRGATPQLVVYGGEFATAGPFRRQSVTLGLTVPLMGSDGIKDPAYITAAGPGSAGDFASSLGAPPASLPGGPAFLAAYQSAGFAEPPSDFGAYAYDAANLIIEAVGRQGVDRARVIDDVQAVNTTGVTGRLAFDNFGDTLNKVVTIYRVQSGAFVPQTTITVP